jgi:hypothetical protein
VELEHVLIGTLKPYAGNARTHDLPVIRESLRKNGQYRPLVVRKQTREVLAGNGTLVAALEEGWTHVWASFVDVPDDAHARRIVLVDNRTNDLAGYDDDALMGLLGSLDELEGTGFSEKDLARLQDEFETGDQAVEETLEQRFGIVVELHTEEEQAQVMEQLVESGYEPRALYG